MKLYSDSGALRIGDNYPNKVFFNLSPDQSKIAIYNADSNRDFTGLQEPDYFEKIGGEPYLSMIELVTVLIPFVSPGEQTGIGGKTTTDLTVDDIDWDASDFTDWEGEERDLFGNVNNGGIYNETTDNPKVFILRLKRTKKMRDFGIGTAQGEFSNIKATLLGSGDSERGVLDLSFDPAKLISAVYSQEEFTFNAIKIEFLTTDRIDVTNLFLNYSQSDRKQDYIHKFGLNPDIDSGGNETIWTLGDQYIFTTTPQAYFISSSNAGDGIEVEVETIGINNEGRYQREVTVVTLQGQNKVQIPTSFLCTASNRARVKGLIPASGDIYIYEDGVVTGGIPDDLGTVRSVIAQGREQTEQAVYTVPEYLEDGRKVYECELYKWNGSAIRGRDTVGVFDLRVAERGGPALVKSSRGLSTYYVSGQDFGENTPLSIVPGSDIYIQASEVDQNNVTVEADFTIRLVTL